MYWELDKNMWWMVSKKIRVSQNVSPSQISRVSESRFLSCLERTSWSLRFFAKPFWGLNLDVEIQRVKKSRSRRPKRIYHLPTSRIYHLPTSYCFGHEPLLWFAVFITVSNIHWAVLELITDISHKDHPHANDPLRRVDLVEMPWRPSFFV